MKALMVTLILGLTATSVLSDDGNRDRLGDHEDSDLQERLSASENQVLRLEAQLQDLRTAVEELRRREREQRQIKPAFSASLKHVNTHGGSVSSAGTLVFKHIHSNVGNAYDDNTGIFTAPVKGTYYFAITLFDTSYYHRTTLYKNDEPVLTVTNVAFPPSSTWNKTRTANNSVVLELEAGDEVLLYLHMGQRIYDDPQYHLTTFSGFML